MSKFTAISSRYQGSLPVIAKKHSYFYVRCLAFPLLRPLYLTVLLNTRLIRISLFAHFELQNTNPFSSCTLSVNLEPKSHARAKINRFSLLFPTVINLNNKEINNDSSVVFSPSGSSSKGSKRPPTSSEVCSYVSDWTINIDRIRT